MPIRRPRSPARGRVGAVVAAGVIALALSGCVGDPAPTPTPPATTAADPIFASDEEALAAAVAVYEQFLVVSAQTTGTGGTNVDALDAVAIGAAYEAQLESAAAYAKDKIHTTGRRTFATHRLQSFREDSDSSVAISFYVCDDLRGLGVVDASGISVVAPDRIVDVPYLVVVEGPADALRVSEKDLWERENFCS